MTAGVNVKVVEDDSVELKLKKVALRLSNKYNKKRKINERLLKKQSLPKRILNAVVNVIVFVFFAFLIVFVASAVYNKVNNIPPSFAGYFGMQVVSPSMVDSGFKIGDNVIVREVNTHTLKDNDIIAFYAKNANVNEKALTQIHPTKKLEYSTSFAGFWGVVSPELKLAAQENRTLVFHHIKAIYQDANGKRYFKTYGSSNFIVIRDNEGNEISRENSVDNWIISEDMIVGSYDGSLPARISAKTIKFITTPSSLFIILLIPVAFMIYSLLKNALKNVQLAFLESDVVEEKRKLTDQICVDNNIGYRMNTKTKYKVLAQAPDDRKLEYINLLWKTDNRPENLRKYYLRKGFVIRPMQRLRDVNRNCEQMFKDGVAPTKIAKYYTEEKEKIQEEQKRYKNLVRMIGENNKNRETAQEEEQTKAETSAKPATEQTKPAAKAAKPAAKTTTKPASKTETKKTAAKAQASKKTPAKTPEKAKTTAKTTKPAANKTAVAKRTKNTK